jgi:hypothetical protein
MANFNSLARPRWDAVTPGVFRIVSDVAYEETFLLREDVLSALRVSGDAVFTIPNRGVLLAADCADVTAVNALIAHSRQQLEHGPWPLSGLIFQRTPAGWRQFAPPKELAAPAHSLRTLDLARTYHDQKAALDRLHERTRTDVFVATFILRADPAAPEHVRSWCTWSAGVETLLPKTDHVIFNADPGADDPELILTDWGTVDHLCKHYLKPTPEDPPRFRVNAFPTTAEWTALKAASNGIRSGQNQTQR